MPSPPLRWKVVYWGPQAAGKTTSLRVLARGSAAARRGVTSIVAQPDHAGCRFELLPLDLSRGGRPTAHLDVFTVPGCPLCVATRGLVLQRADAIVFVADAHPDRLRANRQAAFELLAALQAQGRDPASLPLVIQSNKRELPRALPADALRAALRPLGRERPLVESVATLSEGVAPALRLVTRALLARDGAARRAPPAPAPAAPTPAEPTPALPPAPAPKRRRRDRGRSERLALAR
ncbi:MAG: gliding-motility protein MglA [Planctomycetes bacterium]|nr:gliding-motility protein MglA [Planctomycetota bacterium]